jgi:class 3 adenylate cyclase/tetratricopeptide (TPR) repeat protein
VLSSGKTGTFGSLLRQHRLAVGLTQAALAERSGVAERTIQDLERGVVRPRQATVRRLVGALALPPAVRSDFEAVSSAPRQRALAGSPVPEARPTSSGRDTGPPALHGTVQGELAAERKSVTVLCASVHVAEPETDLEPEHADRIVRSFLERLVEIVRRYDGTVSQRHADGFAALFGAPVAQEDHAVRACHTALALRALARCPAMPGDPGVELRCALRVGLDSGEVSVGTVHDDKASSYTAIGPTVRAAARLAHLADDGAILLGAETSRLVEGHVDIRPVRPTSVDGHFEAAALFELLAVGLPRSRFQAARIRPLSGFVGRTAELNALALALARAQDGRGQVVAVIGEPGIGKSRLVYELLQRTSGEDITVLEGGALSHGTNTPFLPLLSLLRAYFGIGSGDDVEQIRQKVAGAIARLDPALEAMLPDLLGLFEPPPDDRLAGAESARRRRQTLDAVLRLLLRESQQRVLLLVVEDLHWIDSETQAFLDLLVESLPAARVLLLITYRPEYWHEWSNRGHFTQLRVDPLEAGRADELLTGLVGDDASLDALKVSLLRRTEGNPFFLEESVRSLVETGALAGGRGAYRLPRPITDVRVPVTVRAVLAARIDRLPPAQKALLQAAAVTGKDVPAALLRALAASGEDDFRQLIGALQASEFMYETGSFPELEYTFKHALTHEVAYDSLLQERRKLLHGRVVESIEDTYPDRLVDHVERLAHHVVRAERGEQAVASCRHAGAKAAARSINREAVTYFEQALEALSHLPESRDRQEQEIDLRLSARPSLVALSDFERMGVYLHEALAIAEMLGDQRRIGRVSAVMTNFYFFAGQLASAKEVGRRAVAVGEAIGDLAMRLTATEMLCNVYTTGGAYPLAIDGYRWILATLEGVLPQEHFGLGSLPALSARHRQAWCLAELGAFAEGEVLAEEAVRLGEAVHRPHDLAHALYDLGRLYLRRGSPRQAVSFLERSLALFATDEMRSMSILVGSSLGAALTLGGRVGEALSFLEKAVEQISSIPGRVFDASPLIHQGEAYLVAGRSEDAARSARRALDHALTRGERSNQAYALRLLGGIAAGPSAPAKELAEEHYREALALATELGMRPLQAHCHFDLGKLYRHLSRDVEARTELSTAVSMYRAMGMTLWLPEAESELGRVSSRIHSGE